MSRNSRSYAVTALLAACMSILATAHAQTSAMERSLLNRVGPEAPSLVGVHQPASTRGTHGQSQASRALLGAVGAIQFAGPETVNSGSRLSHLGTGAPRPDGPAEDPQGELTQHWAAGRHCSTRRSWADRPQTRREAFMFGVTAGTPESEPESFREPRMLAIEGSRRAAERLWLEISVCCSSARRDQRLGTSVHGRSCQNVDGCRPNRQVYSASRSQAGPGTQIADLSPHERTADVSHDYRKYLVGQGIIGAGINFVLNGAIGWMLYRHLPRIPLYGEQSIAGDIVVTSFLLPMLACLIATPLIRSEVRKARLPAASWLRPGSSSNRPRSRQPAATRRGAWGALCAPDGTCYHLGSPHARRGRAAVLDFRGVQGDLCRRTRRGHYPDGCGMGSGGRTADLRGVLRHRPTWLATILPAREVVKVCEFFCRLT